MVSENIMTCFSIMTKQLYLWSVLRKKKEKASNVKSAIVSVSVYVSACALTPPKLPDVQTSNFARLITSPWWVSYWCWWRHDDIISKPHFLKIFISLQKKALYCSNESQLPTHKLTKYFIRLGCITTSQLIFDCTIYPLHFLKNY